MSKNMAIFASDLHGNRHAYEKILLLAKEEKTRTVILGGDLTPKWPILSFGGGALIPLCPKDVGFDSNQLTYVDFLERIQSSVKNRSLGEKKYTWLGGYMKYLRKSVSFKHLLEEQRVLRKLYDEDRSSLDEDEWHSLVRLLRPYLAEQSRLTLDPEDWLFRLRFSLLSELDWKEAYEAVDPAIDALKVKKGSALSFVRARGIAMLQSLKITQGLDRAKIRSVCENAAKCSVLNYDIEEALDLNRAAKAQKSFLEQYFTKWLKRIMDELPGTTVYFILGNDDVLECEPVAQRIHEKGLAVYLHGRTAELEGGLQIAGYPYVPEAERFYNGWHKSEGVILTDLVKIDATVRDPAQTVYVVHCPPSGTSLDCAFGNQHYGSSGVKDWIASGPKHCVLSGHIHESPFMEGGEWRATINGVPCFQPGGWHDEGLCAVVLDLSDPSGASWIRND